MKKQLRYGFTLVELLVVISIIGMLAGLLLPAINAARESGRRAVCMANQSQIALALLNYENARGAFPPMRGEVFSTGTGDPNPHYATWAGFLLPLMEYNQIWERMSSGRSTDAAGNCVVNVPIPILKCKSASLPTDDTSMSYVVNGGYQNACHDGWAAAATTTATGGSGGGTYRFDPGRREDAAFFDNGAIKSTVTTLVDYCKQTVSVDYISTHSGTSYTIILSENVNAGEWLRFNATESPRIQAQPEEYVAFCYPYNKNTNLKTPSDVVVNAPTGWLSPFPLATGYVSTNNDLPWHGYAQPIATSGTDPSLAPLFINVGRTVDPAVTVHQYRRARPSSNHPGTVVAVFADRSTRTLNENMDKQIFVHLCQPYSGVIINPASLNQ